MAENLATEIDSKILALEPLDNARLNNLCGSFNEHIHQLETFFNVKIHHRDNVFNLHGDINQIERAEQALKTLYSETVDQAELNPAKIYAILQGEPTEPEHARAAEDTNAETHTPRIEIRTKQGVIKPRGKNQTAYIDRILNHDINFGVGPAGTGKTYLAVLCAVHAFETGRAKRILLVRPAVEAGEKLGFLPGDLIQKIDPYLRPLYDALYEMMGFEKVNKLLEREVIEIAPLAYMRGRTLNDAFIILDESQNATIPQMKMFLTRVGFNTTVVITGDITQVDLPPQTHSGLTHALRLVRHIEGISITEFNSRDVMRHPLVQKIVDAYEAEANQKKQDKRHDD